MTKLKYSNNKMKKVGQSGLPEAVKIITSTTHSYNCTLIRYLVPFLRTYV